MKEGNSTHLHFRLELTLNPMSMPVRSLFSHHLADMVLSTDPEERVHVSHPGAGLFVALGISTCRHCACNTDGETNCAKTSKLCNAVEMLYSI